MKKDTLFPAIVLLLFTGCKEATVAAFDGGEMSTDSIAIIVERDRRLDADDIVLEKEFLYDDHTLEDRYAYKDTVRMFQWDKIKATLAHLENEQKEPRRWAILRNRGNANGQAPLVRDYTRNAYGNIQDNYEVERYQAVPFYDDPNLEPLRYGRDGMLVELIDSADTTEFVKLRTVNFEGEWWVPERYVKSIETDKFYKTVFVDRANQNITALDKSGGKWLIRSMNPATTGVKRPPYAHETPLGIFVVQEKKEKMIFLRDGTTETGGYAPYASRFCNGAYIHGVPVNAPATATIEFSSTLGTVPRSHMCVRNATSHAKFIYDWAPVEEALVVVIE